MEKQGTEMSLQELAAALQETNEKSYGGSSDFNFDISRERRFYEERISEFLKQQRPELSHTVVGIRQEIEGILEGIRENDVGIMKEYIKPAIAA